MDFLPIHGFWALLVLLCASVFEVAADQYNPHVYPRNGPFFEGWYIRFMDFQVRITLSGPKKYKSLQNATKKEKYNY